jgi:hypothetical protein
VQEVEDEVVELVDVE